MTEERKPKVHDLKCWPQPFADLATGDKRCEVRVNDRDYGVGDRLVLREWDPATEDYTGLALQRIVTHILLGGGPYGLPEGLCVLSVVPLPEPEGEVIAGSGGGSSMPFSQATRTPLGRLKKKS